MENCGILTGRACGLFRRPKLRTFCPALIQQRSGGVGNEKLDSLSKLTNAYSRLYERHKLAGLYPLSSDEDDKVGTVMIAKKG